MIGAILAGGRASRLGGGDKGLREIGGRPVLDRVLGVLRPHCETVVLSANGDPARFAALGLSVVADAVTGHPGPLAGVLAVMDWAASSGATATHIVTAPGDVPFLPIDFVERLEAARRRSGATTVCARSGGATHPVAALWPVALRADLRLALCQDGMRKVGLFLARQDVAYADWPIAPFDPFLNINTPDDLARAQDIAARHEAG